MAITDSVTRLSRFPLFQGLSSEALAQIGDLVEERRFRAGQVVFSQGQEPDRFYLVESGEVLEAGLDPSGATILKLQADASDFLGRWSLYNEEQHLTTATVLKDALLLSISTRWFRMMLNRFPVLRDRLQRTGLISRLRAIPLFSAFSEEQLAHVADAIEELEFSEGQTIFAQGDLPDGFYIIDTGRVLESISGRVPGHQSWPKYFTAGNFFGRYSLLNKTKRRASATAETDVRLFRIHAAAFDWFGNLVPDFSKQLHRFDMLHILRSAHIFSALNDGELKRLAGYVGLAHSRPNDIIFYQGEIDSTYYLLYDGEALARFRDELGRDRPKRLLKQGDGIGETSLFFQQPCGYTVRAQTSTNWLYLTGQDLDQFLLHHPAIRKKLVPTDEIAAQLDLKPFDWMDLDEKLLLQRRRHWYALLARLLGWPTWSLVGLAVVLVILGLQGPTLGILGLVLGIVTLLWVLWVVIDWRNDYFVVTTKRIVHREKILWLRDRQYEIPLGKVQNVNIAQLFIGSLLSFGTLLIDTAATLGVERLTFTYLRKPEEVKGLIFEEMRQIEVGQRLQTRRDIRMQLEGGSMLGIRPIVPKPVAPPATGVRDTVQEGFLTRLHGATLGALFWVEDKTDAQVTWRKHRLRLLQRVWMPTLIGFAAILVWAFLLRQEMLALALLILILIPTGFWWWWGWADWGNDLYIVTNDRIIDTERTPLRLSSKRTEAPFDRVQNVSSELPNFWANLFNFGTVFVHTAGAEGRLDFTFVAKPRQVRAEIFRRVAAYEEAQRRRQEETPNLAEWFAVYDQTHRP